MCFTRNQLCVIIISEMKTKPDRGPLLLTKQLTIGMMGFDHYSEEAIINVGKASNPKHWDASHSRDYPFHYQGFEMSIYETLAKYYPDNAHKYLFSTPNAYNGFNWELSTFDRIEYNDGHSFIHQRLALVNEGQEQSRTISFANWICEYFENEFEQPGGKQLPNKVVDRKFK